VRVSDVEFHTGRRMPALGLGTWQLTDDTDGTVEAAMELGYRMIDTAVDYGTQPGIGEAIRRSGMPRDDIFLVTKVEEHEDAYEATGRDLEELGLDYADLMLIHRPPPHGAGQMLWEGLIRAREDGLTRDIGVSNYSTDHIEELREATGELPVVNQIEWSPYGWSDAMYDYCRRHRIVLQAYSPLTRGKRLNDSRLRDIAARCGRTPAQVMLRWHVQCGVVPVPKANRRHHLEENLGIFDFDLSDGEMAELGRLNEGWSSLGASLLYV
jgi:2,5-diketo-D-gluconate reductase A